MARRTAGPLWAPPPCSPGLPRCRGLRPSLQPETWAAPQLGCRWVWLLTRRKGPAVQRKPSGRHMLGGRSIHPPSQLQCDQCCQQLTAIAAVAMPICCYSLALAVSAHVLLLAAAPSWPLPLLPTPCHNSPYHLLGAACRHGWAHCRGPAPRPCSNRQPSGCSSQHHPVILGKEGRQRRTNC